MATIGLTTKGTNFDKLKTIDGPKMIDSLIFKIQSKLWVYSKSTQMTYAQLECPTMYLVTTGI